jgi:hypothetical chaperone protein
MRENTTCLGLDFGGDPADFSVLGFDGDSVGSFKPIAHSGIGVAGDHFVNWIVGHAIAPVLGRGGTYESLGKTPPTALIMSS